MNEAPRGRELETFITLLLADQAAELAQAHDELYPERVAEHLPLSLTLLYPWIPAASLTDQPSEMTRSTNNFLLRGHVLALRCNVTRPDPPGTAEPQHPAASREARMNNLLRNYT